MLTKALPAKVKALEGDAEPAGTFEAIVAAYNTDSVGDKIMPGAFSKSLAAWSDSGDSIPVIWSHQHADAFAHIGSVSEAKETDAGLYVKGSLDIEDNPTARQVYRLMKGGRIKNYSFAYDVNDAAPVKSDDSAEHDGAHTLLKELTLLEVGPCLVGANRETHTLAVKAAIPVGAGPTSTTDAAWDGPANEAHLSNDAGASTLRKAFAWVDGQGDADTKSAYKFIHHMVSADGTVGAANIKACITGIGVLNGGRGGTVIPSSDRQGVYNHLAAHIRAAGDEPPDLKTADEVQQKAGAVLSAANRTAIRGALQAMQDAIERLEAITGVVDSDDTQGENDGKAQTEVPVKQDDEPPAKDNTDEPTAKSDAEPTPPVPVATLVAELELLGLSE